ncbi:MAG: two-component response regulator [Chthonomonadaceae bacterium]|nr:two-component response regulator [Chthonomonadaceae bacterium]
MEILLVDADLLVVNMVRSGLEASDYFVDSAMDGDTGLEMAIRRTYSLLILEVILPKRNGFELCRALRVQGIQTPILMLTVCDTAKDWRHGFDAGANDYMVKPFAFRELRARAEALLHVDKTHPSRPIGMVPRKKQK